MTEHIDISKREARGHALLVLSFLITHSLIGIVLLQTYFTPDQYFYLHQGVLVSGILMLVIPFIIYFISARQGTNFIKVLKEGVIHA